MMKWFLFLAAFLPITPTMTEVVASVSDCSEFLLEGIPPEIPGILENNVIKDQNRYKPICQTFKDKRRFLTVYDTANKIPVFSAYKFRNITATGRPNIPWMIEPQLSGAEDRNMVMSKAESFDQQASFNDYKNSMGKGYNKGHLYPSSHGPEADDKKSTFTLTNIVPQAVKFNSGSWNKTENCVKCVMEKFCINNNEVIEGFVVVIAQPSAGNILKNGVNIPEQLLSAFCCYSSIKNKWLAGAHWAPNTEESANINIPTKTVEELNMLTAFNAFPGQQECLKSTVTEFYEDLPKSCSCPPVK